MPRPPRQILPGVPVHIVQRGNNRQNCFCGETDYRAYLAALAEAAARYQVSIHAFVLMTNHVHMLATPEVDSAISRMIQQLGRKYVAYYNKAYTRTGTLWEGRFRSSLVSSLRYLFACHRYIELNPVRANLVDSPEQYPWSSYRSNALGHPNSLLSRHSAMVDLAETAAGRRQAYRRLFIGTHNEADESIREASRKGKILA